MRSAPRARPRPPELRQTTAPADAASAKAHTLPTAPAPTQLANHRTRASTPSCQRQPHRPPGPGSPQRWPEQQQGFRPTSTDRQHARESRSNPDAQRRSRPHTHTRQPLAHTEPSLARATAAWPKLSVIENPWTARRVRRQHQRRARVRAAHPAAARDSATAFGVPQLLTLGAARGARGGSPCASVRPSGCRDGRRDAQSPAAVPPPRPRSMTTRPRRGCRWPPRRRSPPD